MKKIITFLLIFVAIILPTSAVGNTPIYRGVNSKEKYICLTFDDGPHPQKTDRILDVLNKENVKATFFVIGRNVEQYPEILKRIIDEEHEVGNHTYNHNLKKSGATLSELNQTDEFINRNFEYKMKLYSHPGGIVDNETESAAMSMGYDIILWDVDTKDWTHKSAKSIENNVIKNVKNGSIILMHDYITGESNTAEALETIIPKLKKDGYEFLTVSELISKKG